MPEQHTIFYTPPESIQEAEVAIRGREVHHIRTVMRKKPHDELMLTDGKGNIYTVHITAYARASIRCRIVHRAFHQKKQERHIACAFVPLKGMRSDFIIEKCTEIGVAHFYPFISRRAVVRRLSRARIQHFRHCAISAMLQSRRLYLPEITICHDVDDLCGHFRHYDAVLCGDARGTAEVPEGPRKILYVIGPEGGFDDSERALFGRQGVRFVSLGDHRLRSETAAIIMGSNLNI